MRTTRRTPWLSLLLPLLAMLLLGPAAGTASAKKSSIRVNVGDQSPQLFANEDWQALKMKRTRYFFPWNGMDNPFEVTKATQFVDNARAHGVDVLLHLSTDDFRKKKGELPTSKEYRAELKRIVPYFRERGVEEWGVWNEANHASQPTYKSPVKAALYFREMYREVSKGDEGKRDKIVALDVLDQAGVKRYMQRFYRKLSKTYRKRADYIGIHNYGDVNRNRSTYTSQMIRTARHYNRGSRFWFTETGGLVEFGKSFKCSTSRAAKRMRNVFTLANRYKRYGVQRIYLYNFFGAGCKSASFDAGLVSPSGKPRAGYRYLKKKIRSYKR